MGVHVDGEPNRNFFTLDARGVADHAWHDSDRYFVDPAPRALRTPSLLLWGASDRIVTPACAAAFGNARPHVIPEAGHLPHIEQPEAAFTLIDACLRNTNNMSHRTS
ncbi:alpha/beta fold hydrolase [Streptomyces sp. NBC_00354]|uniref:alpha/beta fold hydrolase n=1 Tax=Streptomyces sp. NBC_00354 TaxID=2975723 RepID=UPI003FA7AE28